MPLHIWQGEKKTRFNHQHSSARKSRARAYVYIRQLIQSGRKRRATLVRWIYITIDRQRKILDIRVFGNRRVTCTYVFLNKHSLTVSSDHVKVTILGCIMRELRQIFLCLPVINCFNISYRRLCERESSIVACILWWNDNANKLSLNVSLFLSFSLFFDGL